MSHYEELRHSVVGTFDQTTQAWKQHEQETLQYLGFVQMGLKDADDTMVDFARRIDEALQVYGRRSAYCIKQGSEGIEAGHGRLSRVLEGTTNSDAIVGLEKIGEARQASTEIIQGIANTSEAIAAELAAKVAAVREVIRMARAQIFEPFLTQDDTRGMAEAQAPSTEIGFRMDPTVGDHLNIAQAELNRYIEES